VSLPSRIVTDATIWIDLHEGGLVPVAFSMNVELIAPDVVIARLDEPDGEQIVEQGLQRRELSKDQIRQTISLLSDRPSLSAQDCFACVLAESLDVPLLTGDKHLRRAAEEKGLKVHGALWLMDQMVRTGILTPRTAADSLESMLRAGSRLPQDECTRRIRPWRGR